MTWLTASARTSHYHHLYYTQHQEQKDRNDKCEFDQSLPAIARSDPRLPVTVNQVTNRRMRMRDGLDAICLAADPSCVRWRYAVSFLHIIYLQQCKQSAHQAKKGSMIHATSDVISQVAII